MTLERLIDSDNDVRTAYHLANTAHSGQTRRDGVTSYFEGHIVPVAKSLLKDPDNHAAVIAAALLHDILEDTSTKDSDLLAAGVSPDVIEAVKAITKIEGVPYEQYLKRVKANPIARRVKIADMIHNLSDGPTTKQIRKYAQGLLFLVEKESA